MNPTTPDVASALGFGLLLMIVIQVVVITAATALVTFVVLFCVDLYRGTSNKTRERDRRELLAAMRSAYAPTAAPPPPQFYAPVPPPVYYPPSDHQSTY